MPTVITHALVGVAAGKVFAARKMPRKFWDLTIVCALLPDIDVVGFMFGVPYGSMWGHRGFTHSPFFAVLVGLVVASIFFGEKGLFSKRWWRYFIYFFIVTALNGFLDAFTNGGMGVAFLAPFSDERFFFPWRPIYVSPIGYKHFFTRFGWYAVKSEIFYVWIPTAAAVLAAYGIRKYKNNRCQKVPGRK